MFKACGTKSGQILLNCVTDAIIVNIYIKYRLKLIENELGHTFESPKMVKNALLRVSINFFFFFISLPYKNCALLH